MPQAVSASQAAELLFNAIPHGIDTGVLEEYGVEASEEQARMIRREVLLLALFWIRSALDVNCPRRDRERIMDALLEAVRRRWEGPLKLQGQDPGTLETDMEERRRIYDQIVQEGGAPMAVFTETASLLESASVIREEDRGRMLALLLDLVPVDDIGELVPELQLAEEPQR